VDSILCTKVTVAVIFVQIFSADNYAEIGLRRRSLASEAFSRSSYPAREALSAFVVEGNEPYSSF
jgi:hypothetical protein